MEQSDLQVLKDWCLSTFVQKDSCNDKHEKVNEEINERKINEGKIITKLSVIQWVGITIGGTSIVTLMATLYNAILK